MSVTDLKEESRDPSHNELRPTRPTKQSPKINTEPQKEQSTDTKTKTKTSSRRRFVTSGLPNSLRPLLVVPREPRTVSLSCPPPRKGSSLLLSTGAPSGVTGYPKRQTWGTPYLEFRWSQERITGLVVSKRRERGGTLLRPKLLGSVRDCTKDPPVPGVLFAVHMGLIFRKG